jgi:hypothetical protein
LLAVLPVMLSLVLLLVLLPVVLLLSAAADGLGTVEKIRKHNKLCALNYKLE